SNPVLLGFDVVEYHFIPSVKEGGVAVQGLPEHAYNFQGYQFWFKDETNRNLFINDPWKYAPAWGGFCSWGVGLELPPQWPWQSDFLGPPAGPWDGWAIVNGTLIFNIWESYTDRFLRNSDENMKLAAERWRSWHGGELQAGPFNTHCIGDGPLKNWCLKQQPAPWLQELPECEDGGGIVSSADEFGDFSNSSLSPYQRNWIVAGAVLGALVLIALIGFLICPRSSIRNSKQSRSQKYEHADSEVREEDDLSESTHDRSSNEDNDRSDASA
ncbi:MAG: hypothetical protein SGILL_008887, partial [Bacillariaceae sp.]